MAVVRPASSTHDRAASRWPASPARPFAGDLRARVRPCERRLAGALLGSRGLPCSGLVPAGFEPVPAGLHRAPPCGVGTTAVQKEEAALRVLARPQMAGHALFDVRPREHKFHGEPALRWHLQVPLDARRAGLRDFANACEDSAQTGLRRRARLHRLERVPGGAQPPALLIAAETPVFPRPPVHLMVVTPQVLASAIRNRGAVQRLHQGLIVQHGPHLPN